MAMIRGMSDRLREAVNKSGMTYKQIGQRAGMSESRLKALLTGNGGCYTSTFAKLCAALNLSADYVLGLKGGNN